MAYSAEVAQASRQLTAAQKLAYEDTSDMRSLNEVSADMIIEGIVNWAWVKIHNDRLEENPDYDVFVIDTESGEQFYTSSPSFREAFTHIWEVVGSDWNNEEPMKIDIKLKRIPSRNYKGKEILSCKYVE